MLGYVLSCLFGALLLRFCLSLTTDLRPERNSLARALVVSVVLMLVSGGFSMLGSGRVVSALALGSWLLVVKSAYDVSWGRAFLAWLLLAGITIALFFAIFTSFGALAGGLAIL